MDREFRTLLARLELVSHGSTQQFDSAGGHQKPGSRVLRADRDGYPHLTFRAAYLAADRDSVRRGVVEAARTELHRLTHTPPPGPSDPVMLKDQGHLAFKRMVLAEPGSVSEVARKFMVSRQSIYTWRRMYGEEEAA